jgi:hypothetical protein
MLLHNGDQEDVHKVCTSSARLRNWTGKVLLTESNLHPLSIQNLIFKFADDTNQLVPQHSNL